MCARGSWLALASVGSASWLSLDFVGPVFVGLVGACFGVEFVMFGVVSFVRIRSHLFGVAWRCQRLFGAIRI